MAPFLSLPRRAYIYSLAAKQALFLDDVFLFQLHSLLLSIFSTHSIHSRFAWGCHSFCNTLHSFAPCQSFPFERSIRFETPRVNISIVQSTEKTKFKMKTFAILASASLVAGHGYVTNATLGGTAYTFYQPYTDPYTSPTPERVSRPIQGNGPVTDLSYQDLQCGGDTVNGVVGSSPANLTATVAAGSTVDLYWTLWPESHVGPSITCECHQALFLIYSS